MMITITTKAAMPSQRNSAVNATWAHGSRSGCYGQPYTVITMKYTTTTTTTTMIIMIMMMITIK